MKVLLGSVVPEHRRHSVLPALDYEFALVQSVLANPKRWMRHRAGWLLLDNGAHENGTPATDDQIIDAAMICRPDAIIAPDYLGQSSDTIRRFSLFMKRLNERLVEELYGVKIYYVAQCAVGAVLHDRVFREYPKTQLALPFRIRQADWFEDLDAINSFRNRDIHLLGLRSHEDLLNIARWSQSPWYSRFVTLDTTKIFHVRNMRERLNWRSVHDTRVNVFENIAFLRKALQ